MKATLVAFVFAATLAATPTLAAPQGGHSYATVPRAAWADADRWDDSRCPWCAPADSLYRAARLALTQKEYDAAAKMFDAIVSKYPKSEYAPDALYWKGFALYRGGSLDDAAEALESQARRFPNASTHGDAAALLIQIKGQLAKRGDASAQRDVDAAAAKAGAGCGDMETQTAALDAIQQMDGERVLPLLGRVLARRDACSAPLRKNALFILAQKSGPDREKILLNVAKTDPDMGVRQDAVFHLQQAKSDAAVDALEDLLKHSDERGVKSNAIFALSQMKTEHAQRVLRAFALSGEGPVGLRNDAVFQLASGKDPADLAFLKELYGKASEPELKSNIMFQIASRNDADADRWLGTVMADPKESPEQRKNALFQIASHMSKDQATGKNPLPSLYDAAPANLKKEVIFHLGQRHDDESLDKLISIAKTDAVPQNRKEALFQLGQSKSPKALKALEEIVAP